MALVKGVVEFELGNKEVATLELALAHLKGYDTRGVVVDCFDLDEDTREVYLDGTVAILEEMKEYKDIWGKQSFKREYLVGEIHSYSGDRDTPSDQEVVYDEKTVYRTFAKAVVAATLKLVSLELENSVYRCD